jgi:hypothetical protein
VDDAIKRDHCRLPPAGNGFKGKANMMRFTARVVAVNYATGLVQLSRTVPYTIRAAWKPQLHR